VQESVNQPTTLTIELSAVCLCIRLILPCPIGNQAQSSGFGQAAQSTIGRFISKPMTREEACKILNVEE
jgi:hypothetical protein